MRCSIPLALAVSLLAALPLRVAGREDTLLDSDWRFQQEDISGAEAPNFNDGDWQSISIPHNWGWDQAQRGEKYLCGPDWYRRDINIPAPPSGRRCFLRFEAAGSVADVYLNGKLIGQHRGAFGAFCFEITQALSPSG